MCGIASVFLFPQARSPEVWQEIRENFTKNLLFNEKRGEAATGIAIIDIEGKIEIYKQSISAHQFIATEAYQLLINSLNEKTVLILGHTRLPTKGCPSNNSNNHPIQAGPVCGVHNGHITNDDFLFGHWGFPREAEVDSEIIFRLLENCGDRHLKETTSLLSYLEGRFTFLATDRRIPGCLFVVKHNNPLSLHFVPQWNSLIFSSSYIFLRKNFGSIVVTESVANHHVCVFNVEHLVNLKTNPWQSLRLELSI